MYIFYNKFAQTCISEASCMACFLNSMLFSRSKLKNFFNLFYAVLEMLKKVLMGKFGLSGFILFESF